jgi:hypothetical protein
MKILEFECTALSDLVLSETVGTLQQSTLGFIPGSALRGIAAAQYSTFGDLADQVFHSGQVSFGNAYPVVQGRRAQPMPLSFYGHPTDKKDVINGVVARRPGGYKKVKDEFFASDFRFTPNRRQAIKTAIDREYGTAKEGQLFLYEALPAGMEFSFEVVLEDTAEAATDKIKQALVGVRRVGRSKGAEFGKIDIRVKAERGHDGFTKHNSEQVTILLVSDLCLPWSAFSMAEISPELFGLTSSDWRLDEEKSFIAWAQVSFFNKIKNTRSSARQLIKRGSVISFVTNDGNAKDCRIPYLVGAHTEEGFGAIEVNPAFMRQEKLQLQLPPNVRAGAPEAMRVSRAAETAQLIAALKKIAPTSGAQVDTAGQVAEAARKVREYVAQVAQPPSAAQWGNIRRMAEQAGHDKEKFEKSLNDSLSEGRMKQTFDQEIGIRSLREIVVEALQGLNNYPADVIQFCKLVQGGSRE